MFIQKYINLYYNKILQKRVANAIQTGRLFLGEWSKVRSCFSWCRVGLVIYNGTK